MKNIDQSPAIKGMNYGSYDWMFDSGESRAMLEILMLTGGPDTIA